MSFFQARDSDALGYSSPHSQMLTGALVVLMDIGPVRCPLNKRSMNGTGPLQGESRAPPVGTNTYRDLARWYYNFKFAFYAFNSCRMA